MCSINTSTSGSAAEMVSHPLTIITRDYCGNYVLRNDTLERVMHATGYWTGCRESRYFVKDYLGNVRSVIDDSGHVLEHDGYYPYGAASNAAAASVQPLKFSGKDLERHGGLGWHDFEARWLANGRFTTQDPNVSSFAYKLSKDEELKTMTIIAPTREIGVDKSYKSEVRTLIKDNNGRPIGRESGWWIFIRNGKVFDSFGPKWEAKEEPSFWDKLFK